VTSLAYGAMQIGVSWPQTHKLINTKFGMGDYVGCISPHAKINNNRPSVGFPVHAKNMTLAWFLVFL